MPNRRPGDLLGNYRVEGLLGTGGQGIVYEAVHVALGSRHAIKLLRSESPAARSRLLAEGRIQAALRHPHLVPVTDVVEVDGALGLVADRVPGVALDVWVFEADPSLEERLEVLHQVCVGLAVAHAAGVVHRDLKPANILIEERDGHPFARVTDFGIAKAPPAEAGGRPKTLAGSPLGTLGYMAPEQLDDASTVDARADVFALGCLGYELLTGARPFPDASLAAYATAVHGERQTSLAELGLQVPDHIAHALDAALSALPDHRPADAGVLANTLRGLRLEPTLVPGAPTHDTRDRPAPAEDHRTYAADGGPNRTDKPPRRRRFVWIAAALGALTVGAIIIAIGPTLLPAPAADAPPEGTPAPSPVAVAVPAPPQPTEEVRTPSSSPPAAPTDTTTSSPVRRPSTPTESVAAPTPGATAPVYGRVVPAGDGTLDTLTRGDERASPSRVPEGTWHMRVRFDGGEAVDAGTVEVHAGDTVRVQCVAEFLQCRVSP